MNLDLREWLPDLYQYKFTFLYAAGQLALARRARGQGGASHAPPSDRRRDHRRAVDMGTSRAVAPALSLHVLMEAAELE